jgi:hypothetical protein
MAEAVPLNQVPKDADATKVVSLYNPLSFDFVHKFDGDKKTVKADTHSVFPENVAQLLAVHLAKVIVTHVVREERERDLKIAKRDGASLKDLDVLAAKAYPRYDMRVGDLAKALVGPSDSKAKLSKDEIMELVANATPEKAGSQKPKFGFADDSSAKEDEMEDVEQPTKPTKESEETENPYADLSDEELFAIAKERNITVRSNSSRDTVMKRVLESDNE